MKDPPPIQVTRTTLPPFDEYIAYLRGIWDRRWVTNNGPLVRDLEERLRAYLGVEQLWFVNNGTTALQIALKALALTGEVLTTPFSYVATTGVLVWENLTPVFVDVRPDDLTIDPEKIEAAITPRTTAILATHVYGFPCDVGALETIARKNGLKVIYDAAHAFGCALSGRSLASFGDISCLSFHATKVFNTIEGGAVVINGPADLAEKVRLMRAFGHFGDDHRTMGINGKNSEFHAAMGLCNLPRVSEVVASHRAQKERYASLLQGTAVRQLHSRAQNLRYNYAYFPVLMPSEPALERVKYALAAKGVFPRRYFFPSLNCLPYVQGKFCPVSEDAAARILCLPLSDEVTPAVQELTIATLRTALG